MPRKILKKGDFKGVSEFSFKVFSTVDKGISSFVFKPIDFKMVEDITEKEESESKDLIEIENIEFENRLDEMYKKGLSEGYQKGYDAGKEEGFQEGYRKGVTETEQRLNKEYEARKEEYINLLKRELEHTKNYIDKLNKYIDEFDNVVPQIVIKFVQDIIGMERKINDKLILNIVKKALNKLKDIEIIDFIVNPKDIEIVKEYFPDYNVIGDHTINPGSLRVRTKIGEADFTIESVLNDLTKNIYEELGIN